MIALTTLIFMSLINYEECEFYCSSNNLSNACFVENYNIQNAFLCRFSIQQMYDEIILNDVTLYRIEEFQVYYYSTYNGLLQDEKYIELYQFQCLGLLVQGFYEAHGYNIKINELSHFDQSETECRGALE